MSAQLLLLLSIAEKSIKDICLACSGTEENGGKTQGGLGSCICNVQNSLTMSDTLSVPWCLTPGFDMHRAHVP